MIRTDLEYRRAKQSAAEFPRLAEEERESLRSAGLEPEEVERAVQPLLGFQQHAREEIEEYERWMRGELPRTACLSGIGILLIAARVARGMKQRELAGRLGVSTAVVSRDEANEYHGISMERAQRILDALGVTVQVGALLDTITQEQGNRAAAA